MKKNKPTYITDLTTEIMNNRDLLNAWAENSVDMNFLELSVDILSDLNLLFSWDCDNVLQLKLAGIVSGNQDFKYKGGILIKIDESYDFPVKPSLYKKIVKELIDIKSLFSIIRKDLINQGHSLDEIKKVERENKIASFIRAVSETEGYERNDFNYLNENLLPKLIEQKNELKKQFLEKKADKLIFPFNDKEQKKEKSFLDEKSEINGENPLPFLFKNNYVYECFLVYQKHIIDFYIDYSYLKKRLDAEHLIHYHKDNDFMKIIYEKMNLISKKNYEDYIINGKLDTLKRSSTAQRENNFNIIFGGLY